MANGGEQNNVLFLFLLLVLVLVLFNVYLVIRSIRPNHFPVQGDGKGFRLYAKVRKGT
jgi:hypothetical protein